MAYCTERKASVIAKMLPPHNQSLKRLSAEEGISMGTLSRWRSEARARGQLLPDGQSGPEGWSSEDKLAAVIETAAMNEAELLGPQGGRGRMTSAPDRKEIIALVNEAMEAGARCAAACEVLGVSPRTLQRWRDPTGEISADRRPDAARPVPRNKLSEAERDQVVATCNAPEFASLPPSQIVPRLADQGRYIGSESSMYRVLKERGQNHRRGRARPPSRSKPPASFQAKGPCEVWSWDITWLPGPVGGTFFHLYLILDIFSRKIVGWEVCERETAEFAAQVLRRAVWAEGCLTSPLVLHADNGSLMRGATMKVTMERIGVVASFSRPRVSNDTPFSEALFRTCKYAPTWPTQGFAPIEAARSWVAGFVGWYNTEHRHSAIRFVTPEQRHRGEDRALLASRHQV